MVVVVGMREVGGAAGTPGYARERKAVGNRGRVAERRKTNPAVLGGMIAVVVGGAGFGAYALFGGGAAADSRTQSTSASADDKAKDVKTGPLSATEVTAAARRFLTAWQQGEVTEAAAATDDTAAAKTLLTGYTKDAHIKDVTLTAGPAPATRSPSP